MDALVLSIAALIVIAALLVAVAAVARKERRQTTYVCSTCLYASSSHEDALRHVTAVHPRS